jgi:hypothetical protein
MSPERLYNGLPEKPIWPDPIFNGGGVIQDFLFFIPYPLKTPFEQIKIIKNFD